MLLIGYAGGGTRNIFANTEVSSLEEIQGLKIRVQGAPIWSSTFSAIGMSPTVIAYNEVYNAIQNERHQRRRERGGRRRADEVLRGRAEPRHDPARDHDPAAVLLQGDLRSPARGPAAGDPARPARKRAPMAARSNPRRMPPSSTRWRSRTAEAHSLRGSRRDEGARRSGDGGSTPRRSASPRSTSRSTRCSPGQTRLGSAAAGHDFLRPLALIAREARHGGQPGRRPPPLAPADTGTASCLSWLLAISLGILVIPVALQIFSRFTALIPHYIWTEEMARFLFVWTIMVGAMIGVRESTHFEVDLWPRLSRAQRRRSSCRPLGVLVARSCSCGPASSSPASAGIASPSWPSCRSGDPHRLADRRGDLADLPRRADVRRAADRMGKARHDRLGAVIGQAAAILFGLFFLLMFLRVPIASRSRSRRCRSSRSSRACRP